MALYKLDIGLGLPKGILEWRAELVLLDTN